MLLEELLPREVARTERSKLPFTLMLLGVQNRGATASAEALQRVAGQLRSAVGPEDVVARYGDKELAVVIPGLVRPAARQKAEQLRVEIEGKVQDAIVSIGAETLYSLYSLPARFPVPDQSAA